MQQTPIPEQAPAYPPPPVMPAWLVTPDTPTIPSTLAVRPRRTWYIVLIFCFFAAVIPESIATTATSVDKILKNPGSLLFVMAFYGPADLLIREAMIRRRLGWVSLVLLGIAFGFMNEGVAAGTWYTIRYDGYAFIGDINYAWATALTIFHIFISVILPIAFIETLFPSRAGQPLLRRRGIVISAIVFLGLTLLVIAASPAYQPYRLGVFALALVLAIIALRLPAARPRPALPGSPPSLRRLRWAGFFASLSYFAVIVLVPQITLLFAGTQIVAAQVADIVVFVLYSALLLRIGRRWTGRAGWTLRHTLALIVGVLLFPILLFLLPPLWSAMEPILTLPFLALVIWRARSLCKREQQAMGMSIPQGGYYP